MKIAVLFYGRINGSIEQYQNFMQSIIQTNEVDFFISYSKTKNTTLVNSFLNMYKPKKFVENDEQFRDISKYKKSSDKPMNILYNFQNRLKVIKLFDEYVKETDSKYDFLIGTRCDLWYFQTLNLNILNLFANQNKLCIIKGMGQGGMGNCDCGGINDQFALGNYENISVYLRLYEDLFKMLDNNIILHPETLLLHYLTTKNVQIERFDMIYNIKRYSDYPKIIDCFMFYNETELLTYRLHTLKYLVDYFVIVESTHTHQGKEKKLYSNDILELFETFRHQIIHIVVDDFPHKYPNIDYSKNEQWINENYQRNCIKRGIDRLLLNDNDVLIISDLDEIPDPRTLDDIRTSLIRVQFNRLEMDFYFYNLYTLCPRKHITAKVLKYEFLKKYNLTFQDMRELNKNVPIIKNGGWHLTFFGDKYFVKNKLESFAHQEYNNPNCTNIDIIEYRMQNNIVHDNQQCVHIPLNENNYLPLGYEIYLRNFF
jgi:beta-1,4-mannosyl-glycoprotein beta-1,4-N-acetylglucosaminyltransferase